MPAFHKIQSCCRKVFLCFLVLTLTAHAQAGGVEEPYMNELRGPAVAADNFFSVADEKYNNSGAWSLIETHISTDNIISFELNHDTAVYFYAEPFTCTINFKIYIYNNVADTISNIDSTTYSDISLQVAYDTVTGKPYKSTALFKFNGAHRYKVKIINITSPELSPVPPIFRLKGQIIAKR